MAPQSVEEYITEQLVRDSSASVREYLGRLERSEIIELLNRFLDKHREASIQVPVTVLSERRLAGLEAIVLYLRDELRLSNALVSELLGRSQQVCWNTYANAKQKFSGRVRAADSRFVLPLRIFHDRKLSVLESVVMHLRSQYRLNFHEIAELLKRDDRTIWTVYQRAMRKA